MKEWTPTSILMIGPNGYGKSLAAASFAELGETIVFDFDGREQSILNGLPPELVENIRKPIKTYGPRNFTEFRRDFEGLQDYPASKLPKVIIIDSFTALTLTLVNAQMIEKGKLGKGKVVGGSFQVPTWDEINGETSMIGQMLDICKMLPNVTFIWTAHPITKTEIVPGVDGKEGTVKKLSVIASFGPKVCSMVPGYFNEIYIFEIKKAIRDGDPPKRLVWTCPTETEFGKTALGLASQFDITGRSLYRVIQKHIEDHGIKPVISLA